MRSRGRPATGLRRPVRVVIRLSPEERDLADALAVRRGFASAGPYARYLLIAAMAADQTADPMEGTCDTTPTPTTSESA